MLLTDPYLLSMNTGAHFASIRVSSASNMIYTITIYHVGNALKYLEEYVYASSPRFVCN